ncbi:MAG: non-homologous end-joining DNA ligase [Acidimicrobiia bacterium]
MAEVSNPTKLYFPQDGITKAQVVRYYESVAEAMVPHLRRRPLTLQRFPDGIERDGFMQKNASRYFPTWIERVAVPKAGGSTNHPLCDSVRDLTYLANQGTITFHIWTSRLPDLTRPDRLVLDLDPAPGAPPPVEATLAARQVLEDVGLLPGVMTTGSRGYHVVAPIRPQADFEAVGHAARLLALVVEARHPHQMTTAFHKADRGGRVFVDWLRNRWAQSTVSPWSLRPLPGAPVAMPIDWSELDSTPPGWWTVVSAPERVGLSPDWPPGPPLNLDRVQALAEEHRVSDPEPFDRFSRR